MMRSLLRGAQVITMAAGRPDVERADILIENGVITATGQNIDHSGTELHDFSGRIIMPGLINAHLHTWQTAMRFAGADWSLSEYLANVHGGVAHRYGPEDMHIGTLAGALNQIDNGVTTIGDWCHNCLTPEHADAAIDALKRAGVRAVFLHGTPHALVDRAHDTREIDRLLNGSSTTGDLLSVGMAIKGPQLSKPEVVIADLRAAAERGIVASMHQSAGPPGPGWQAVSSAGLWGSRTNIVHGTGLDDRWVKTLVECGVSFTSTPENELGQGHCTRIGERLLHAGSAPSLGTDTDVITASDLLVAARILLAQQRGLAHDHTYEDTGLGASTTPIAVKEALSWATVQGAQALGLSDRVGRIEPGKQADLVVIDTRALNMWPAHDPVAAALHAHAGNIEAVMIAGVWRKRNHALIGANVDAVMDAVHVSGERLVRQVHSPGPFGRVRARIVRHAVRRQLRRQVDLGNSSNVLLNANVAPLSPK
jgi:cytosine/adenosine deaminase-related metal-dependent hydrolase